MYLRPQPPCKRQWVPLARSQDGAARSRAREDGGSTPWGGRGCRAIHLQLHTLKLKLEIPISHSHVMSLMSLSTFDLVNNLLLFIFLSLRHIIAETALTFIVQFLRIVAKYFSIAMWRHQLTTHLLILAAKGVLLLASLVELVGYALKVGLLGAEVTLRLLVHLHGLLQARLDLNVDALQLLSPLLELPSCSVRLLEVNDEDFDLG